MHTVDLSSLVRGQVSLLLNENVVNPICRCFDNPFVMSHRCWLANCTLNCFVTSSLLIFGDIVYDLLPYHGRLRAISTLGLYYSDILVIGY